MGAGHFGSGLPEGFRFFLGGGAGIFLLKIIICIKSGTLLGNILVGGGGGVANFGRGDSSPKQASRKPCGLCIIAHSITITQISLFSNLSLPN